MSEDSKLQEADFDQIIAGAKLDEVLGKNYIDNQDFSLLPDTIKTLPLDKNESGNALYRRCGLFRG